MGAGGKKEKSLLAAEEEKGRKRKGKRRKRRESTEPWIVFSGWSSVLTVLVFLSDLPDTPVDLVINCLDCHENAFLRDQPWYKAVVDWANQNRAPVLSIDPPINEMEQGIDAKWSLALGLPLPLGERAGRVYLCDIGIPQKVFQEVGINYHSPFGCKFVIPLHST